MKVLFRKLRARFKRRVIVPPDGDREIATLPEEGERVSVEKALNSRCTSDYDDDPEVSHWGMFDRTKRLSEAQVTRVVELARIPRFTGHRMEVRIRGSELVLVVDNQVSGIQRDWLMIENGMQQQAIALVCAALGVGMAFRQQGPDGTVISPDELATIRIWLDAMKPSYAGCYWTPSAPTTERAWKRGNLPDPARDGDMPLLKALQALQTQTESPGKPTSEAVLSQLLWAARGRTPHLCNSAPWGMTIPAWKAEQDGSAVHLLTHAGCFKYVNWRYGRPTHRLQPVGSMDAATWKRLLNQFTPWNAFVLLSVNAPCAKGLWEVGYQLLNALLEAHALGVGHRVMFLDADRKPLFHPLKVPNSLAIIGLNHAPAQRIHD